MRRVVGFFLSPKLTVVLLSLGMVLVFAGTLAQVDQGIWSVMDQYFRCYVARIDLHVFFPRSMAIPNVWIPFPGGFLIGWLLVANLVAVHWAGFRIQAAGSRKVAGLLVLMLGVLVTLGVMLGWGTASVAATESDAFWRVFLRLGRGTLAAAVLYIACVLLYRKRAGMVLLHGGILFLLIGEFATANFAVEASMTIKEGESINYIDHSQQQELSFTDTSNPGFDTVTVVPGDELKDGALIKPEGLPFDIKVNRYMANSSRPRSMNAVPEEREASGDRDAPAVDIELFDRATGESLGNHVLSIWFYPNFVNRAWDMPTTINAGGKEYTAYLRFRREYLRSGSGNPYSIKLLDFVHEKYEGTQMPKDFSSQILLVNEGDDVERELRIWMNNPLRYARRTFYQSSYLPDESGTVLQVVRNDSWMIPYLSCMIVFVGMAAQFIQSLGRYLGRKS